MIDSLLRSLEAAEEQELPAPMTAAAERGGFGLCTLHRPSNVDERQTLAGILAALSEIAEETPLFLPIHPRTRARIESFGLQSHLKPASTGEDSLRGIFAIEPLSYLQMLRAQRLSSFVLTDSGGLQEETTVLGVPCVTIRENTERPITITEGTNVLAGTSRDGILRGLGEARDKVARGNSHSGTLGRPCGRTDRRGHAAALRQYYGEESGRMTTMIFVFLSSLGLALLLTPLVRDRAMALGVVDHPGERRVHDKPIARAGGVAVFVAFGLPFAWAVGIHDVIGITNADFDASILSLLLGAAICFGIGLWDDVKGASPRIKVTVQALAAAIAYLGGIQITKLGIPGVGMVELGLLSGPVTILWFLVLVNAINLIDGLDGLAAGIIFFAAIILLGVHSPARSFSVAIGFAALAGSTLGFLRYNFNPASIFLGDSGAYFLGFIFAGLSVLGSLKTPATVGLLIPLIAIGVPLFDVLLSPIRRFILGRRLFAADRDHLHHRMLGLGYTQRRAVLTLYASTFGLGVVALAMLHARDERAALGLVVIGAASTLALRKLGYLDFIKASHFRQWLGEVSDQVGVSHTRRAFLARELAIRESRDADELFNSVGEACGDLDLLSFELELTARATEGERRCLKTGGDNSPSPFDRNRQIIISMPLTDKGHDLGTIRAVIASDRHAESPHLLRRIDQLRRAIAAALENHLRAPLSDSIPSEHSLAHKRVCIVVNANWFFWSHRLPIARALRDAGAKVTIVAGLEDEALTPKIEQEGFDFLELKINRGTLTPASNLQTLLQLRRIYAEGAFDFVHHVTMKPVVLGTIAARMSRVPNIINAISGRGYMFLSDSRLGRARSKVAAAIYRAALSTPRMHAIFQNHDDSKFFVELGSVDPRNATIIRGSGVNPDLYEDTPEPIGRPVALFASRLLWDKGFAELLEAGKILRRRGVDYELRVAGRLDPGNPAAIDENTLQSLHRDGQINWLGFRDDVPELLAACHVVVLPSYGEGLPRILLEAGAAGRPIVSTDVAGCREFVRHGVEGLLCPPRDPERLADALGLMITNPELRRTCGEAGRGRVRAHFSEDAVVTQTLDLYSAVASSHSTPRADPSCAAPSELDRPPPTQADAPPE